MANREQRIAAAKTLVDGLVKRAESAERSVVELQRQRVVELQRQLATANADLKRQTDIVEEAYRWLEQGSATPEIAAKMREQTLVTWLKVAANNLRQTEAQLDEVRRDLAAAVDRTRAG